MRARRCAWEPCTSPRTWSGLADSDHAVEVRAIDMAGNADLTPARRAWRVVTVAAARVGFRIAGQRLRAVASRGLRVAYTCPAACRLTWKLSLSASEARRLGLGAARARPRSRDLAPDDRGRRYRRAAPLRAPRGGSSGPRTPRAPGRDRRRAGAHHARAPALAEVAHDQQRDVVLGARRAVERAQDVVADRSGGSRTSISARRSSSRPWSIGRARSSISPSV